MDTARNGAGKLVEHANRQGPWLAPGQRSLAGPGIRDHVFREFWFNTGSGAEVERFTRGTGIEKSKINFGCNILQSPRLKTEHEPKKTTRRNKLFRDDSAGKYRFQVPGISNYP